MESRFYTQAELTEIRVKTTERAEQHCAEIYGPDLGPALFRACLNTWGAGPATTVAKLSDARDLIKAALELKNHIAGVMLIKNGLTFSPLYLHSDRLAYKLSKAGDYWIPFKQVSEELKFSSEQFKDDVHE